MKKVKGRTIIAAALGAAAGSGSLLTYLRYRREIEASTARLRAGSRLIETSCGPIEYTTMGVGPPVLAIHGAGGGYDQGLLMAPWLGLTDETCWIAVSRFGYLRTPLPAGASPAAQADAYAALLDALDLPQVTVIGTSAGGPSVLQFALRHPDRCTALVQVSAICRARSHVPPGVLKLLPYAGFVFWAMATFAPQAILSASGVDMRVLPQLALDERSLLYQLVQTLLPFDLRWAGVQNDGLQLAQLGSYPLHRITVPTLVIHAVDDSLVPFADGKFAAESIPGARLLTLNAGDHHLVGQRDTVMPAIAAFVSAQAK